MIETNDYWILDDKKIFFKPKFNENISKYNNIICKYNKLIFSNYNILECCIQTNNTCDYSYSYENLLLNKFNNYINLSSMINLTHIVFGFYFNSNVFFPSKLTHLIFGNMFNRTINLPCHLTHLEFGEDFNCEINLPPLLTHLIFGIEFNSNVNLPSTLKYLKIDSNNKYLINNLIDGIEELHLEFHFRLKLNDLPNSIKKIIFSYDSCYSEELNCLPNSLEYLILNKTYNKKINIPKQIKKIICSDKCTNTNHLERCVF